MHWVRISAEQAERHPLYGLRGWLRLASIVMALPALAGPLVTVVFGMKALALPPEALPAGLVVTALLGFGTGIWVVSAVLWFRLVPWFLPAWLELSGLAVLLDLAGELALRSMPVLPAEWGIAQGNMLEELAISLVLTALPALLLWRSRRFRLTFRHEVRSDDAELTR